MTEMPAEMAEMIEDLHALCERGLACHLMSDVSQMCVTCRAAQMLYLQHAQLRRMARLVWEEHIGDVSDEMADFRAELVEGCWGWLTKDHEAIAVMGELAT